MKPIAMLGAAVALTFAAAPASAAVTVLTFDEGCVTEPCTDGQWFMASYGDTAEVDVSYQVLDGPGAGSLIDYPVYWNTGYGDLSGVAWSGANGTAEVAFSLLQPNTTVSLLSLDTAGWAEGYESAFRVYDLSYNLLYDSGLLTVPEEGRLAVDLQGITSTSGLRLQWDETWGVAIDNLAFSIDAVPTGAVPEPTTWAMMILGFGAMGSLMRRRQRPVRIRYA